jgi:hypothetical protein
MAEAINQERDDPAGRQKREYVPPKLTSFGSLSDMTHDVNAGDGGDDSGWVKS